MAKQAADLAPITIPPKLKPDIAGNVDEEHSILKIFSNVEEEEARGRQSDESLQRRIEGEEGDGDYEFSFVCGQTKSPISADDIFQNGRIRPLFQVVGGGGDGEDSNSEPVIAGASSADEKKMRSLSMPAIRKVFVERTDLPSTSEEKDVAQHNESSAPAPEVCKKSNSTGFSKLFRLKEMLLRSYSDGKDAFVFLESKGKEEPTSSQKKSSATSGGSGSSIKGGKGKGKAKAKAKAKDETTSEKRRTSSSYGMNMTTQYGKRKGGKEGEKRRSYLPYKQDLVGFFTNVNGMSRNLHPY